MSADFETWLMRGALLGLCGLVVKLLFDRMKRHDDSEAAFRDALTEHREATDQSMKEFRTEFMGHLDRLRASHEVAFGQLNATMAEVARTAGEIRTRMAERYATKEDLSQLEGRIEKRFQLCSQTCPMRGGDN